MLRQAYHPVNQATTIIGWDKDTTYPPTNDTWNEFTGVNRLETCPPSWRRPMMGDTTTVQATQPASGSELMQSLFETTVNGVENSSSHSLNHRYWGYYADGYFDRHPITASVTNIAGATVSATSKDAAYIGLLFTNPATGASLFMPATGYRISNSGTLNSAGSVGYYWYSSAYDNENGWEWSVYNSNARVVIRNHTHSLTIRCVKE